ncbi:MAG TPA: LPS export ABC transporter permease LptG [Rhodospirillaceae bacterium]|nr:LPS export ABC transporter permease LptG [Rhodospirillaceae bacterium]
MMKSLTLSRYLGRQYMVWFFAFLFGLGGIIYLFEVAELMRRSADLVEATLGVVLRMGAYKLPETIEKILPFVVLFSGMFTFWRLTRNQELVIARAAGVSAWQFLAPALLVTLVFGIINVTLVNPVGATMATRYKALEARYFKRSLSLELTGAGLWLRQEEGERRYLLHADKVSMDPLTLTPLIVFVYDQDNIYLGRIDAPRAVLSGEAWKITDAWFNAEGKMPEQLDLFYLKTSLTLEKIQDSMASLGTISFWQLPDFIEALKSIGLPPVRHELQFQMLLAQPVLLCAMVFFAAAFSLRMNRRGGSLNALMAGVIVGSIIFSLNNVVTALGANQTLPVILAAWAIPLVALVAGQATLLYLEDG